MSGAVLDTGALIALERGSRDMATLVSEARSTGSALTVPAGCVAQAWRDPRRQARIAAFLRLAVTEVVALDHEDARRVGLLLAATGTSDVVDGHVAVCAHRLDQAVVTSDPDDIASLGPSLRIHRI